MKSPKTADLWKDSGGTVFLLIRLINGNWNTINLFSCTGVIIHNRNIRSWLKGCAFVGNIKRNMRNFSNQLGEEI